MTLIQWFIFFLIIQAVHFLGTWKLYEAAGRKKWEAAIPVYNAVVLMKIINRSPWWTLLLFVPVVANVLDSLALALLLNLKELFRLFVNGVKAPVEVNVWIVFPPDVVTRPPLNTCEPAYEMITIPLPPAPDLSPPPPPPPPVF